MRDVKYINHFDTHLQNGDTNFVRLSLKPTLKQLLRWGPELLHLQISVTVPPVSFKLSVRCH